MALNPKPAFNASMYALVVSVLPKDRWAEMEKMTGWKLSVFEILMRLSTGVTWGDVLGVLREGESLWDREGVRIVVEASRIVLKVCY